MKILNERQYRVTKAAADRFARSLQEFDQAATNPGAEPALHPLARQAMRGSIEGQWQALCRQLEEYEAERSTPCAELPVRSLDDIPEILIRARISTRMTQKDLADRLHLKEQQVQRWEQTRYKGVAWERLQAVLSVLDVQLRGQARRGPAAAAAD
jgi:ribosome-binding protein aMBF1 (putative translation factor)